MTYRIEALPLAPFAPYFAMSDKDLAAVGARRWVADAPGRAPCRVSLRDADAGEALVLVNHAHLTDPTSPYRASGPIFVRESAVEQAPITGPAPEMLTKRPLSLRLYDHRNMMIEGLVIDGADLDARLAEAFDHPALDQIHIHFAPRGCYLARACRIEAPLP
ncbi:MAG: DUF1203 domain-containing protein [Alphaproteobacteria bacterium]|uniref:DUF1203 domain-containing protein n=1 Tax=Brevundimonas mediterranea TaxID=74329 RepID=A0A7Z9C6N5_9CAUL|nr:DUF1203 domain-containing protein [Brevundimonas mediterranea]MBU4238595.1 DUF1203 domain-containing protein [Alphaproteobacteria bacterium]VDC51212.1 hypothetical protein BREV_BREV_02563 [Brevundimonas mediterranea]